MGPDGEAEFRAFVAARSGALLRTARILVGESHAEDLVQEALARLVPHWHKVDEPEAYARVTMHRLQISRWRRRAVIREDAVEQLPSRPLGDHADAVDDHVVIRHALARLSPRQRAVLVCRYVEDLDENRDRPNPRHPGRNRAVDRVPVRWPGCARSHPSLRRSAPGGPCPPRSVVRRLRSAARRLRSAAR